jgi:hypothetical protein
MRTHRLFALASVTRRWAWCVALSVIAGASLAGCPGSLDNPGQYSEGVGDGSLGAAGSGGGDGSGGSGGGTVQCNIPVADVPEQLIRVKCATSSCHDASNPAGELDMISPGLEGRLLDQDATCPAEVLVDTMNPENSFLLDKVASAAPRCGGERMPLGGMLPPEEIACIREWINLIVGGGGQTDAATDSAGNAD